MRLIGAPNRPNRGTVKSGVFDHPSNLRCAPSPARLKDEVLDNVARVANVAQFLSFDPSLAQRYSRIYGREPNLPYSEVRDGILDLLNSSTSHLVNVRTFDTNNAKSGAFVFGLSDIDSVIATIAKLGSQGLFTIVNENIDVNDGGVSGVCLGGIVEFAPGGTPRCVEAGDIASLPRAVAGGVFQRVYGFVPNLDFDDHMRVEFSIHPNRVGFQRDHTIIWEMEDVDTPTLPTGIHWPNEFSRLLGDKLFGLVVADVFGFRVPYTVAIPRRVKPFAFGVHTESRDGAIWIRTCPKRKTPGKFATVRGWTDPFVLLEKDDPEGELISSIIIQDEVEPAYSGGLLSTVGGEPIIEGVSGRGSDFMLGLVGPSKLPEKVALDIETLHRKVADILGPVRIEWVHDEKSLWVVQLQQELSLGYEDIIVPASADRVRYIRFRVENGLPALRDLIAAVRKTGDGIILEGHVGLTSHLADILRESQVPSKRIRPTA